jgi:hypothetical protein
LDRRLIGLIWIAGAVLMVAVYVIGPQHVLAAGEVLLLAATRAVDAVLSALMWRGLELLRAAAIALYGVFVVLAVLAMQRRVPVGGMLFGISLLFLLLARTDWFDPGTRWLAAVVLNAIAATTVTKRLLHVPPPRDPATPWGLGRRHE